MKNGNKSNNSSIKINNATISNNNNNNSNNENDNNSNNQSNGKQSDFNTDKNVWKITADHYLLSLVWMIVPFIPASGKMTNLNIFRIPYHKVYQSVRVSFC